MTRLSFICCDSVPSRDLQLSQLERALTEKEDMLQELSQQRLQHVAQLSEAGRTVADLETMLVSGRDHVSQWLRPC